MGKQKDIETDVDMVVNLTCSCGAMFDRPERYTELADNKRLPSLARFYQRKLQMCDECIKKHLDEAMKSLPEVIIALAGQQGVK